MKTLEISSSGSKSDPSTSTTAPRKPLTVSPNGVVRLSVETISGNTVNPTDPDPKSIELKDIAWALSRIPRFGGHTITEIPYNVAQHSIYVSELLEQLLDENGRKVFKAMTIPAEYATIIGDAREFETFADRNEGIFCEALKHALLHDAHEAYLGDIPSPVKQIPELRETITLLEMKLDHAIRMKLYIDEPAVVIVRCIKFCDKLAQAIESYQFMPSRGKNWNLPQPSLELLQRFPTPLTPLASYQAFLERYKSLG